MQSSEEESSSYDTEQIDDNQGNSVSPTLGLVDEDDFHEPYKKKRRNLDYNGKGSTLSD